MNKRIHSQTRCKRLYGGRHYLLNKIYSKEFLKMLRGRKRHYKGYYVKRRKEAMLYGTIFDD